MKKIIALLFVLGVFFTSSCIEQDYVTWNGALVEWDATVMNNPAPGRTYPLLVRQPRPTFALANADALLTRASGTVTLRVNFVAPQRSSDETITYRVVPEGTTAVAGTHYNVSGTAVIPANSSFADVTIQVINPGVASATPVDLVLELEGNATIQPSERYKLVGVRIAQN
jgi:hypothetical protein